MIDATDVSIILHENKFCSRTHLLRKKVYAIRNKTHEDAEKPRGEVRKTEQMGRGITNEDRALALFSEAHGPIERPAEVRASARYPRLQGKPDALMVERSEVVEVKCPVHPKPIREWVTFYFHQIQTYLEIYDRDACFLVVYDENKDAIDVERVDRDPDWLARVRPALELFDQQVTHYAEKGDHAIKR